MSYLLRQLFGSARRKLWALIVAYMLGLHNFYKGEDKSLDNIVVIENKEVPGDAAPKE